MAELLRSRWKALVLAVVGIGVLFWLVNGSESFKGCIHKHQGYQPYQALHEDGSVLVKTVARTQLNVACGFVWANDNNGAISALAGVAVAIFTMTLWVSTNRLWKSAEDQRLTNERAMKASGAQTLQSLAIAREAADAADRSARAAENALVHSRRPYLLVERCRCNLDQLHDGYKPNPSFVFRLQNFGGKPAIIVSTWLDVVPSPGRPPLDHLKRNATSVEVFAVVEPNGGLSDHITATPSRPLDEGEVAKLREKRTRLWLMGHVAYEDIFYREHVTGFCFVGDATGAAYPDGGPDYNLRT